MTLAFIALGSNLGDREAALSRARAEIEELGTLEAVSALYETEPVGGPEQGRFLNQVVALETDLPPERLLARLLAVEDAQGRARAERWGPRPLDLDLLFYGDERIDSPTLTVPHPRLQERRFVLVPLAEISPEHRHPVLGRTAAELLAACADPGRVEPWNSAPPGGTR